MKPGIQIDVWSDVVCPWCFIGTERLDHVLSSLSTPVEVVRHPFLLMPDTPPEGLDIHALLARKYGVAPERLFDRVKAEARDAGLTLDPAHQRFSYPTVRAHTLLRHAAARGTQRALERALFTAHFIEARNISDGEVLAQIAGAHGFAREEVARLLDDAQEIAATRSEADEARRRGISGVPHFVVDGKRTISGAQSEAVLREALAG